MICGVPQGSVLDPSLYTMYAAPLEDIIRKHGLDMMLFADNSQIYLRGKKAVDSSHRLETCIDEIRT